MLAALDHAEEAEKVQLAQLLAGFHKLAAQHNTAPAAASSSDAPALDFIDLGPLDALTPGGAADAVDALLRGGAALRPDDLVELLDRSAASLGAAPAVVDQRRASTSYVFGDIHGCASSLASALDAVRADQSWHGRGRSGLRASPAMIFNGDFVDRGESSVEVLSSLLLLRHVDPRNVVLLRGNHEDELLSTAYGFKDELTEKYGVQGSARLWSHLSRLFAALPLGARIGADGFVVHGGVHDPALRIDEIDAALPPEVRARWPTILTTHRGGDKDTAALLRGLLWSDPDPNLAGVEPNSGRGSDAGVRYGLDVVRSFCEAHGLRRLVRSHQLCAIGWERHDCGGDVELFTVFSSADYPAGEGFNRGAVLRVIDGADGGVEALEFESGCGAGAEARSARAAARGTLSLVSRLSAHSHRLREAFEAAAPGGRLPVGEWATIMGDVTALPLDWALLQPQLAPLVQRATRGADGSYSLRETGEVDWRRMLERQLGDLARASAAEGGGDAAAFEQLNQRQEALVTVFRFLDTDGSRTIDLGEFVAGVKLLNEELPEVGRIESPEELFASLDEDGSGEIDLEEFVHAFSSGAAPSQCRSSK